MKCKGIKVSADDIREMIWEKENVSYADACEAMYKTPEWQALDKKLKEVEYELNIQEWDDDLERKHAPIETEALEKTPEWQRFDKACKMMKGLLNGR